MSTQIQRRRGTTAQHASFTGVVGETTVDTDKDTVVVHDGTTVGGHPLMRENGSNSALALGSAGTPSLKFTGDTNTGIYSPGADQVAISTGGSGRLFVDSNGNVGLGTSSPTNFANYQTLALNDTTGSFIDFKVNGTLAHGIVADSSQLLIKSISGLPVTFGTNDTERLRITSTGDLNFKGAGTQGVTQAVSFNGSAPINSLVIDSSGRLGVGTSSPTSALTVNGSISTVERQNAVIGVNRATSTGNGGDLTVKAGNGSGSGNTSGNLYLASGRGASSATNGFIAFGAAATTDVNGLDAEYVRIDSSGRVGIGTTSPNSPLDVNGAITCRNGGTIRGYLGDVDANTNMQIRSESGVITFNNPSSERARIDSSGRLLVGTSSSSTVAYSATPNLQVESTSYITSSLSVFNNENGDSGSIISLGKSRGTSVGSNTVVQNNDFLGTIAWVGADGSDRTSVAAYIACQVDGTPGNNDMPGRLVFSTTADGASSPTERMRITSGGALRFGQTTTDYPGSGNTTTGIALTPGGRSGFSQDGDFALLVNRNTSDGTVVQINRQGSGVGSISVTTTATAYNTSSDYRLKENVTAVTDGITRLQQLKPSRFNFIADPDKTVDGFIAHEVQTVVPEAITGEKDAVDDDGNPVYQGIDQSKLVPLLTAALQEAVAKIESLEARLTAAGI